MNCFSNFQENLQNQKETLNLTLKNNNKFSRNELTKNTKPSTIKYNHF